MTTILLITLCLTNILCQLTIGEEIIILKAGEPFESISNPGYPQAPMPFESSIKWQLESEKGGNIKILCDDIRMGQHGPWTPECENVYISFNDGTGETKVCGQYKSEYQYQANGPKVTVQIVTRQGGGFIKCTAYTSAEPEPTLLELVPDGHVEVVTSPEYPIPNLDQLWILRSPPATRISLQCQIELANRDPCYKDKLIIHTGKKNIEKCGSDRFEMITKENFGKLRLQLSEYGDGQLKCLIQAITGPHVNQFLNVERPLRDSSEDGVTRGIRNTTCKCGWANKNGARIFFGKEAKTNEFPWMVYLKIYQAVGQGMMLFTCGASIISKSHVLTAAHCVFNKDTWQVAEPSNVFMVLAEHDSSTTSGNEIEIRAKEIFIHEGYYKNNTHDIALIHTAEEIQFSEIIGPACLLPQHSPLHNQLIKLMGWGRTERGGSPEMLQKGDAIVVENLFCEGARDHDICTFTFPATTCFGDSGGPLVIHDQETNRYFEVALVSRGTSGDCAKGPAIATKISSFFDWIYERVIKTDSSAELCIKA